jgi:hypothetical protein
VTAEQIRTRRLSVQRHTDDETFWLAELAAQFAELVAAVQELIVAVQGVRLLPIKPGAWEDLPTTGPKPPAAGHSVTRGEPPEGVDDA